MSLFTRDEDSGELTINPELADMAMRASQCPILVRRDPEGDWWVVVQAEGTMHAHVIDPMQAVMDGYTPYAAALKSAREHVPPFKMAAFDRTQLNDPAKLDEVLGYVMDTLEQIRRERGAH